MVRTLRSAPSLVIARWSAQTGTRHWCTPMSGRAGKRAAGCCRSRCAGCGWSRCARMSPMDWWGLGWATARPA